MFRTTWRLISKDWGKAYSCETKKKLTMHEQTWGGMYTESGIGLYADANEVMVDGWSRAD